MRGESEISTTSSRRGSAQTRDQTFSGRLAAILQIATFWHPSNVRVDCWAINYFFRCDTVSMAGRIVITEQSQADFTLATFQDVGMCQSGHFQAFCLARWQCFCGREAIMQVTWKFHFLRFSLSMADQHDSKRNRCVIVGFFSVYFRNVKSN